MKETVRVNVVAGVVVKKDGKYLLVQENRPSDKEVHEKWNLPAGRVDKGETLEEAAIRESKEESGCDVELMDKIGIFQETATSAAKHAFEAKIVSGEPKKVEGETLDTKWFTLQEIENMKDQLRNEWVIGAIKKLENKNNKNN